MGDPDDFVLPPSPAVRCDVAMTRATYDALTARLASAEAECERLRRVAEAADILHDACAERGENAVLGELVNLGNAVRALRAGGEGP